ncbi:MAG: sulfite exporter TauE/SafE family protein [Lachnospiraceae bacterium]|nr:sulfite exporter TauE/SafE family protein [Lachnospiraceae bacterium]
MSIIKDIIVFVVLLGANLIQAITGFAGTLIAMPPTIKLIGVTEAKALLNVVAQISCLLIVITGWKHINWKEFFKMFVLMAVGMLIGIRIFEIAPMKNLLVAYGMMIVVIALCKLFLKKELELPGWVMLLVILAAGIIHGMFVSGGALLVIYAASVLKEKEEFRATMALIWVTIGCYITGQQIMLGSFDSHVIFLLIIGLIPVFAGTWIGTKLVKKINQSMFEKMTYILLLLSGILAIV